MNLVKENIDFKRGQDSKKALDVGMTNKRYYDEIVNKLHNYGFKMGWQAKNYPGSIYIPFSDGAEEFKIMFNKDRDEWVLKKVPDDNTSDRLLTPKISGFDEFWKEAMIALKEYYQEVINYHKSGINHNQSFLDKIEGDES